MSVYVDPNLDWPKTRRWPFGSVSHMYADTPDELHAMARKLGLKREWCSDVTQPDSDLLHYDLSPGKRLQALKNGAIPTSHRHMVAHKEGRNARSEDQPKLTKDSRDPLY